jgi:hypothetical protein
VFSWCVRSQLGRAVFLRFKFLKCDFLYLFLFSSSSRGPTIDAACIVNLSFFLSSNKNCDKIIVVLSKKNPYTSQNTLVSSNLL